MGNNEIVLFMHISKTGGTTLQEIFRRQYQPDEIFDHELQQQLLELYIRLPEVKKNKIKAISGHYLFGIHRHFSRPITYLTMLRDPVDRVISSYYFLLQNPNPEIKNIRNLTLKEFANLDTPAVRNHQVQHCSGPDINLRKAKHNLLTHFPVVGLTERFDESLFLMKKQFGWKDVHCMKKNVTKKRLAKQQLPQDVLETIRENNSLDIELYNFAKQLFAKRINALSLKEKKELARFKEKQREVDQVG